MSSLINNEIQTCRLIIGCYRECDFDSVKQALGNKDLCKNIGAKPIINDSKIMEYIQDNIKTFKSNKCFNTRVAIFKKEDIGIKFIGNIGIYKKSSYIELGWWLLEEYRHKGYMREALECILKLLSKNRYTIIANIFDFNKDSKILAERVGMKPNKYMEDGTFNRYYIEYKY